MQAPALGAACRQTKSQNGSRRCPDGAYVAVARLYMVLEYN